MEYFQYQVEAVELNLSGEGAGVIKTVFQVDYARGIKHGGWEVREAVGRMLSERVMR